MLLRLLPGQKYTEYTECLSSVNHARVYNSHTSTHSDLFFFFVSFFCSFTSGFEAQLAAVHNTNTCDVLSAA